MLQEWEMNKRAAYPHPKTLKGKNKLVVFI